MAKVIGTCFRLLYGRHVGAPGRAPTWRLHAKLRAVPRIFCLRGQTPETFTGISRIQTGFLVGRFFSFNYLSYTWLLAWFFDWLRFLFSMKPPICWGKQEFPRTCRGKKTPRVLKLAMFGVSLALCNSSDYFACNSVIYSVIFVSFSSYSWACPKRISRLRPLRSHRFHNGLERWCNNTVRVDQVTWRLQ